MRKTAELGNSIDGNSDIATVRRLSNLIKDVELDCECRSRLDDALTRFAALESRRAAREHINNAQRQRRRIETLLFFLKELDDLTASEGDLTVYREIALLFDDIAAVAKKGSSLMRHLC